MSRHRAISALLLLVAAGCSGSEAIQVPPATGLPDLGSPAAAQDAATSDDAGPPANTALEITGFSPTSVHVGDELTVHGRNFTSPPSSNTMSIASLAVPPSAFKASSTATELIFTVPNVTSLPTAGATVTLQVTNANGTASGQFVLLPFVAQSGQMWVEPSQWSDPAKPIASGRSVLAFRLKALVTLADTFALSATTSVAGATATVADTNDHPLATIDLQPTTIDNPGVEVHVLIDVPPGASGAGTVALFAVSQKSATIAGTSGDEPFTIGQTPPPVGNIALEASVGNSGTSANGGALTMAAGTPAALQVAFVFPAGAPTADLYPVTATVPATATGWTITRSPTTIANGGTIPRATFDVTGSPGAAPATLTVSVTCPSNAAFFGSKTFTLRQ